MDEVAKQTKVRKLSGTCVGKSSGYKMERVRLPLTGEVSRTKRVDTPFESGVVTTNREKSADVIVAEHRPSVKDRTSVNQVVMNVTL